MASNIVYLSKTTLNYLKDRIPEIVSESRGVEQDLLDGIDYINLNYVDIEYLQYFRKLKTLVIDGFPGVDDRNFDYIARNFRDLTTLVIKGQPNITKIDLTGFTKLKTLSIISNENLVEIVGLEELGSTFVKQLNKIEFYDNNNYHKEDLLVKNLADNNKDCLVELDALYYIDAIKYVNNFNEKYRNFDWHEKIGFIHQVDMNYSSGEMDATYSYAKSIIDSIIKPKDSKEMKVFVIYTWILKNVVIEEIRNKSINEGIVNAFKNKIASIPTISKFFQFLLRIAGINSYDINVSPRIKFNTSPLGTFKIPSEDYEIVMIPGKNGDYYFDIAWDNDIYKKTGKLSTVFMYNGREDVLYNHKLIFDNSNNPVESMSYNDKEEYSKKAAKRLQNVKNQKSEIIVLEEDNIIEKIISSLSFMQTSMNNFNNSVDRLRKKKKNLEDKIKDGKETIRTSKNVLMVDKMIEAAESSYAILRKRIYELEDLLLDKLKEDDLSPIEAILGEAVSPFKKKKLNEDNYYRVTKSKDDLDLELNKIRKTLNKEANDKIISIEEYKTLLDKATKVYTYLITFAYDKKVIMDTI